MTVTEEDWAKLAAAPGAHGESRRLADPTCPHDLYLVVQQPGNRRLLALRTDEDAARSALRTLRRLPRTRGIELTFAPTAPGKSELRLTLTAADLREVFNPLAQDIIDAVHDAPDNLSALRALVGRFERWRTLLADIAVSGLSAEWRRGLFGELYLLRKHVLPHLPTDEAVRSWTGPTGTPQDFQLAGGAIEVKTSAGKFPRNVVISNERELDDTGAGTLLLAHLSVDERRGGDGHSLNTVIDDIRVQLATQSARSRFDDLLVRVGYLSHQRDLYDEPRYTVRNLTIWHVTGEFPRITEADLRPGVGDCRYQISTVGLDRYVAKTELIRQVVGGEG